MFMSGAEHYLIAFAVGSDAAGIAFVFIAAMRLVKLEPAFATSACLSNEASMAAPEVSTSAADRMV